MNRQERRKYEKQGFSQKSIMNKYRNDAYEQGFKDGIKHSCNCILMLTAYAIKTHLGLGKKRLPKLMHYIENNITSFSSGHLSIEDISTIQEELRSVGCEFKV